MADAVEVATTGDAVELATTGDAVGLATIGEAPATARTSRRGLVVCLLVASTGFFHGYDNGVVNGVFGMPAFRRHMGWPPSDDPDAQNEHVALQQGLTVNGFNGGAALSALGFGQLVDSKGRRPALRLGSALFAVGGAMQAVSPNAAVLIVGRLIAGVGVGLTSSSGTAYIAETAPASQRGAMVGVYQNNICIAILLAAVVNWAVREWDRGWQLALGLQLLMGVLVCIGLCLVPETPRFLARAGRTDEARRVLHELRDESAAAELELQGILSELQAEATVGEATWREICGDAGLRNVVLIGCVSLPPCSSNLDQSRSISNNIHQSRPQLQPRPVPTLSSSAVPTAGCLVLRTRLLSK